jgi:hypothetical protein
MVNLFFSYEWILQMSGCLKTSNIAALVKDRSSIQASLLCLKCIIIAHAFNWNFIITHVKYDLHLVSKFDNYPIFLFRRQVPKTWYAYLRENFFPSFPMLIQFAIVPCIENSRINIKYKHRLITEFFILNASI